MASKWIVGASVDWSRSRQNDLWQAIVGLLGQELTLRETEQLVVGPLENLLDERFEEYATLVFDEAAQSVFLADALNCIYPPDEFEKDFERRLAILNSIEI